MKKKYEGYLIDLDGTMYRGTEKIAAAIEFAEQLNAKQIPHLYVTNNSSKTPEQVALHLQQFGIEATAEHVITTAMATAQYLKQTKPAAKVFMIGEEGLRTALLEKGLTLTDDNPDVVVVGLDRTVDYEKLAIATLAVRNGALFLSTNGDVAIPTERGLMPGNGAITSVITISTGIKPIFIGKPDSIMMEQALAILGTEKAATLMVGDNYDTDILAGINAGLDTLLVHTGVTTKEHLKGKDIQPTYAIASLEKWNW
ncbi:TIGR01457 family HAD-type hydrolase [Bacillus sp. FJAT-50079]|uniref:TIGR01457 family HAD-type hydrolase n=1 Tax=Bacillus sp. FJAT-50079 TaxID=2833577 RepID=UPI001BC9EF6E|nr:TIGR01457 family HAD-type hydrolase [Bacillus sp. FJAT-50079]MBS4208531.1 TIGR01457 family HAD-type hydrolase [Bacillus sp. FJAT-50079]